MVEVVNQEWFPEDILLYSLETYMTELEAYQLRYREWPAMYNEEGGEGG